MHSIRSGSAVPPIETHPVVDTPSDSAAVVTLTMRLAEATSASADMGQPWTPDDDAWDALGQLNAHARGLGPTQAMTFKAALRPLLPAYDPLSHDVALLHDVIDNCFGPNKSPIVSYLADTVHDMLHLPNLTICEAGDAQPNSQTFNSVLPLFAMAAYDYGRLGRTLLWHGACTLFRGTNPSCSDARRDAFKTVIFSFPNPPLNGKVALVHLAEIYQKLDVLGVYES
ncbi:MULTISPECIES: hypothetical protein [Pandoraea]|uniref:hypothetical protein n=1 Tax=Pandoraea TaxID=93217 RepID=UPI001F5C51F7|nr:MULTISPECIES: hypothetical protein [Pandoraea]MCI3207907.1 hypothetical protein [Pandoraea sp. LA3]MDN4585936.1 hypothetical protein [Pandoraea capi]